MWNRKLNQAQVDQEASNSRGGQGKAIENFDRAYQTEVRDYVFEPIQAGNGSHYAEVKSRFGPLAATDQDRIAKSQKDSRFSVNPLLRKPLSIEEEEKRAIEERVRSIVMEIAEKEKLAARDQGYQEGFKKGMAEAHKKIQLDSAEQIARFDRLMDEMDQAKSEIFKVNERIIMEMIFRISRMLLLKELSVDREYLIRLAKELVSKVGVREDITIKINPLDGDVITLLKDSVEKAFGRITNFNVELNSRVKQGGCEIETQWNVITTSIESQLEEIHKALVPEMNAQNQQKPSDGESA